MSPSRSDPPARLRTAISTPQGKQRYVRRLFATIADRYDFITRVLSYGQDRRWKRRLIAFAALQRGERLLDVACGTGDLVFEAAPHVARAVGLDVTLRMVQLARKRETPARAVGFIAGDMTALPFTDAAFDVVTSGYGLRNVADLRLALDQIRRVLAPGGRLLSLDFNRPENPLVRWAYLTYLTIVGSVLGVALHGDPDTYRYIPESIRSYPGADGVARLMRQGGFAQVRIVPVLFGLMTIHIATRDTLSP